MFLGCQIRVCSTGSAIAATSTVSESRMACMWLRPIRPAPAKPNRKATRTKQAAKGHKKAAAAAREGSKKADVIALLQKPKGATLAELMKATGWLPHSVRGFLSGTVRKKMGLAVTSAKGEDGERSYSVKG